MRFIVTIWEMALPASTTVVTTTFRAVVTKSGRREQQSKCHEGRTKHGSELRPTGIANPSNASSLSDFG